MKITVLAFMLMLLSTTVWAKEDVCPQLPNESKLTWVQRDVEDFVICSAKSDDGGRTVFSIYLGNHPYFNTSSFSLVGSGQVGNKPIMWYRVNRDTDMYGQEGLIRLGDKGWAQMAHVGFSAQSLEEAQQVLSILKHIKFRANAL